MSLDMARMACADGITTVVCTPHILPTVYENKGHEIKASERLLRDLLSQVCITLRCLGSADVHMVPDFLSGMSDGRILTLAGSRFLLLEPTHPVMPRQFDDLVFRLQSAGYV